MSFYTSLTGLNAATAMLGVTSNNISNVGTTGFKRSRADFGDIFATSPLQKASSTVGQGVSLKQVSQEFGQGNISFSSNALDLAVTGDGFFPLRSADGLTETYTRNGSFLLNEQFNVTNSAGQRLMAATVDSTGSANVNERVVLTIPQKTSGEAKQTSQVQLGLNFPADAQVITEAFSRTNPATYNKSTAFTVYDNGGNGYLATIYYVKTQNANQNSPYNKWQTHVFVGEDQVAASLVQSTDVNGDKQYVNQYGQIKTYKDVKDELTTAKTQLISLDELTDKRTSVPATATGIAVSSNVDFTGSTTFAAFNAGTQPRVVTSSGANAATDSIAGVTEATTFTFKDLTAGQSVSINGLTYTASSTRTAAQVAAAFANLTSGMSNTAAAALNTTPAANGTYSGTFNAGFTTGTVTGSSVAATSTTSNTSVTDIVYSSTGTALDASTTQGVTTVSVSNSTETSAITFTDLTKGQSMTVNGLTFTATSATVTAAQIAAAFASISAGTTAATVTTAKSATSGLLGTYSGTFGTGFSTSAATGATITATSATASSNVTDIVVSSNRNNLSNLFSIKVDGTEASEAIDLSHMASSSVLMTGATIAEEITKIMNRKFGDETKFDFSTEPSSTAFKLSTSRLKASDGNAIQYNVDFRPYLPTDTTACSIEQVTAAIQAAVNANSALSPSGTTPIKVSYDFTTQSYKFVDGINTLTLAAGIPTASTSATQVATKNTVMNLGLSAITLDEAGLSGVKMLPNGNTPNRLPAEQRFGMKMTYDPATKTFALMSGSTGDKSSIEVSDISENGRNLLGLPDKPIIVAKNNIATRGIASMPAVAYGTAPTVNVTNNFAVDDTNNKFVVTVDGIKGTVEIPVGTDYSLDTFMAKLQKGINALGATSDTGAPTTVNGVKVSFDFTENRFVFTTGTTGSDSFIKISGSTNWGLDQVEAGRGTTSTWIKPSQHKDIVGGALQPKYIDKDGKETTNGDGFTTLPAWSPIFLDKGELTFDTGGKLYSPLLGTQLETVYLAGGKGALTINIDYGASTQYTSPFAVLSQSQDGAPEGDLVGVTIGNDGLVSASFSNGTQKSLAKILLVNFSSPVGLRQIGDSSFLASAASGKPILGTAGSAGFGTLRAGATERANVDLTQELVDLITAQRNFQANAKAIETSTTMTSAIINIRA